MRLFLLTTFLCIIFCQDSIYAQNDKKLLLGGGVGFPELFLLKAGLEVSSHSLTSFAYGSDFSDYQSFSFRHQLALNRSEKTGFQNWYFGQALIIGAFQDKDNAVMIELDIGKNIALSKKLVFTFDLGVLVIPKYVSEDDDTTTDRSGTVLPSASIGISYLF